MSEQASKTILMVEDDPKALDLLARQLTYLGYHVLWARDGSDALHLLEHYRERIHLMLLDVVLPGLSGAALVRLATERHPNLRVIYASAFGLEAVKAHGVDPARVPFLAKPYEHAALGELIEEVFRLPPERTFTGPEEHEW